MCCSPASSAGKRRQHVEGVSISHGRFRIPHGHFVAQEAAAGKHLGEGRRTSVAASVTVAVPLLQHREHSGQRRAVADVQRLFIQPGGRLGRTEIPDQHVCSPVISVAVEGTGLKSLVRSYWSEVVSPALITCRPVRLG